MKRPPLIVGISGALLLAGLVGAPGLLLTATCTDSSRESDSGILTDAGRTEEREAAATDVAVDLSESDDTGNVPVCGGIPLPSGARHVCRAHRPDLLVLCVSCQGLGHSECLDVCSEGSCHECANGVWRLTSLDCPRNCPTDGGPAAQVDGGND